MSKNKSNAMSGFKRFLIFFGVCLLLIAVVATLVYWQWTNISSWISDTSIGITQLFGWGIILVVLVILTLAIVILSKPILLLRFWNKWLGGLILFAAIWAVLGFIPGSGYLTDYSLGGQIGQGIITANLAVGILITFLLFFVGLLFITPKGVAGLFAALFSRLFRRKEPAAVPAQIIPEPQIQQPFKLNTLNPSQDVAEKNNAFPKFKAEPKPRPNYPVYGSKSWLWNRLHPEKEAAKDKAYTDVTLTGTKDEAAAPVVEKPEIPLEAGTAPVAEAAPSAKK
jgi:hypothetical protein